jgi:KipI family sensor histidine kinase inhibitor
VTVRRLHPCGDVGVLADLDPDDVLPLAAGLRRALAAGAAPDGVLDVVPAEASLLVTFDPARTDVAAVAAWVRGTDPQPAAVAAAGEVVIDVRYDGEDLHDVARLTDLTTDQVVAAHTGTPWRVAFVGFAPGFAYLVGGDPRLAVPRLDSPRVRVPAGAVALAGRYSAVYPGPSPGGWRLLGTASATVFDADRDPPALLAPGAVVRFRETAR